MNNQLIVAVIFKSVLASNTIHSFNIDGVYVENVFQNGNNCSSEKLVVVC